ncbi:M48 family metallopeptidase [Cognatishimia sp. F0-27]|uniref:M48 family metallopeptidase n=1 Tax=Cognatishimia sp. F0-27 TaxID=2816855 RepID=UPI001D0C4AA2|nr:M48 family metallopeptidase [Cognatishimia sp. F0-27]MCC1493693.1 M48 family metallopeptidase [Cognatishimia sp. F0-27]
MRILALIVGALMLAACEPVVVATGTPDRPDAPDAQAERPFPPGISAEAARAARQFLSVVETVEPVAERECRRLTRGTNCDFLIVVDDTPGQPPNAFQTEDRFGRPILAFNLGLIASVRNADELAFIMGHEAAHHVLGHLERTRQNAAAGAVIASGIAAITGASAEAVRYAERQGAAVGARSYSKVFELEADQLGTVITARAGYNPVRGAEFFTRIPDPGNRFLGTHPPNAQRMEIVRRTAAGL